MDLAKKQLDLICETFKAYNSIIIRKKSEFNHEEEDDLFAITFNLISLC